MAATRIRPLALLWFLAVVAPVAFAAEPPAPVDAKAAFERLKTLAGTWQGLAGHGEAKQPMTVTYRLASGGSVVMETIAPGTSHEMISMYHLEGDELVMVHYCAIGNQPKLKLDRGASTADALRFEFVSGTNLVPEKDGHIHNGVVSFRADGGLEADWGFWQGGKAVGSNRFELKRSDG